MEVDESAAEAAVAAVAVASAPAASLDGVATIPSPSPSPAPRPTLEELRAQMTPCKIVLRDYFKVYDDDEVARDDDEGVDNRDSSVVEGDADDGYEDSSETVQIPQRRTGPVVETDDGSQMIKPPSAGLPSPGKYRPHNAANTNNNSPHASIYSTSFKQFKLHCCFTPCEHTADSIRGITDHFKLDHNLSAAAMVWDKPMEPGQIEPEWQKRFEVIITHGEAESLEIAKGGFKRIGERTKKGKGKFQCSRCDIIQPQSKAIVRHIEEVHCGFRRYTCALCGKQGPAIHTQIDHWNTFHASHLSSKESLVVYSRHLTLSELSDDEFEKWRSKRPQEDGPLFVTPSKPAESEKTAPVRTNVVSLNGITSSSASPHDVKPAMTQLAASSSATSGISTDDGNNSLGGYDEAEPEGPPANKRLRVNNLVHSSSSSASKQSTPTPVMAAPAGATIIPHTGALLLPPMIPAQETATEPGEYEVLMPVKIRVSDDKIRYMTFGVPRAGDRVKDQIIQLRQLDTSMFLHQNCFPMPPKVAPGAGPPLVAAAAVPGLSNANFINAVGNHVILRPPIHENGIPAVASLTNSIVNPAGLNHAAAQHRLQAPTHVGPQKLLTIPQPPPFPAGSAQTRYLPLTSVAATNGVHAAAAAPLIANQSAALSGIVNGVAVVTPASAPQQQQQQQQPSTLIGMPKPPQQQPPPPKAAPQRVEVGEAGGTPVPAVATVLTRYKCNQCESVYNNRDSIVAHIYTHMKVRPFKCALCNSIAAMSKTILKHLSKEHGSSDPTLILEQRIPNESSYYTAIQ